MKKIIPLLMLTSACANAGLNVPTAPRDCAAIRADADAIISGYEKAINITRASNTAAGIGAGVCILTVGVGCIVAAPAYSWLSSSTDLTGIQKSWRKVARVENEMVMNRCFAEEE